MRTFICFITLMMVVIASCEEYEAPVTMVCKEEQRPANPENFEDKRLTGYWKLSEIVPVGTTKLHIDTLDDLNASMRINRFSFETDTLQASAHKWPMQLETSKGSWLRFNLEFDFPPWGLDVQQFLRYIGNTTCYDVATGQLSIHYHVDDDHYGIMHFHRMAEN